MNLIGIDMSDYDGFMITNEESDFTSRSDVLTDSFAARNVPIKVPIIASPMSAVCEANMAIAMHNLGTIGVIHRFMDIEDQCQTMKQLEVNGLQTRSISIGVNNQEDKIPKLVSAGANYFMLDVANGAMQACYSLVRNIKKDYGDDIKVVSANIIKRKHAEKYVAAGADAIRCGIGAGSGCATREVAACGRNQLEAIADISGVNPVKVDGNPLFTFKQQIREPLGIPVLCDGGIRSGSDIIKALCVGSSAVIVGGLLAPATESPAKRLVIDGRKKVRYAGMASTEMQMERVHRTKENSNNLDHIRAPEGKGMYLDDVGDTTENIINKISANLRHGMSYIGSRTIAEMPSKTEWAVV